MVVVGKTNISGTVVEQFTLFVNKILLLLTTPNVTSATHFLFVIASTA
jgi:hypothetical protein